jgi:hypothetical protein
MGECSGVFDLKEFESNKYQTSKKVNASKVKHVSKFRKRWSFRVSQNSSDK